MENKIEEVFGCKVKARDWLKKDEWYIVSPLRTKRFSLKEMLQAINKDKD